MKNGVIQSSPRPRDFIQGGASSCPWEEVNELGDWLPFKSEPHEMQRMAEVDLSMCTNFAATDAVESILFQLYGERYDFNERALAVMSGQQANGNMLRNVAEAIRTKGLVPQTLHPWNPKVHNTFDKMIAVTDEERADWEEAGNEWLKIYDVKWEWAYDDFGAGMREALKCAPLFVASLYASESSKDPEGTYTTQLPNSLKTTHATVLMKQDEDDYKWIDDSYQTQIKRLAPDFRVPIGIRFWVRKKVTEPIFMETPSFIAENEGRLVMDSEQSGAMGWIKTNKETGKMEIRKASPERVAEMIANYIVEKEGLGISREDWNEAEKNGFITDF